MKKVFLFIAFIAIMTSCRHTSREKLSRSEESFETAEIVRGEEISDTSRYTKYSFEWQSAGVSFEYYLNKEYLGVSSRKDVLFYYKRLPPFIFKQNKTFTLIDEYQNRVVEPNFYIDKLYYQNIQNGYLKVHEDKGYVKSAVEIALFTSSQRNLIVVNYLHEDLKPLFLELKKRKSYEEEMYSWSLLLDYEVSKSYQKLLQSLEASHIYFKLPEYGTQIIAVRSDLEYLENPEVFFQNKLQNYPEEIMRFDWQNGRFVLTSGSKTKE